MPIPTANAALTRAVDVTVALFMLVGLAPLILAVAVALKLEGPGPVLVRNGRLRFRTHRQGPDGQTLERGPVGRLVWVARIDELPQFIALLRGDLSLFGDHTPEFGLSS